MGKDTELYMIVNHLNEFYSLNNSIVQCRWAKYSYLSSVKQKVGSGIIQMKVR